MEFYHLLNRGVDKRKIFLDQKDYYRFIHNLFEFNNEQNTSSNNTYHFDRRYSKNIKCLPDFQNTKNKERELLVHIHFFCLMPNHYHLLVSPVAENGVSRFMKKLNMGYAKYFNEKNDRSGALFEGKYKSIHITKDAHLMYLPLYIHLNPLDLVAPEWRKGILKNKKKSFDFLQTYRWSSHSDYAGKKNFPSITQQKFFEKFFSERGGYPDIFQKYLKAFETSTEKLSLGPELLE